MGTRVVILGAGFGGLELSSRLSAELAGERGSRRRYGQHVPGPTVDGKELHAGVVNENEVRAAAGLTLVIGAVALGR